MIEDFWYRKNLLSYLLLPFSGIYQIVIYFRRMLYRRQIIKSIRSPVPVIVVGNITVGGTGKTPVVIALAEWLKAQGWRPGLVSRGYGGNSTDQPFPVELNTDPRLVGDEAVLLAQKTACPMVVCKDRVAAVNRLLTDYDCNIILSDDGLQHLRLARDIEIAVIDGHRRLGNGWLLPAGPLRESQQRLKSVDFILTNELAQPGESLLELKPKKIFQLINPNKILTESELEGKVIHAVAGIGNPARFFTTLKKLGYQFIAHRFPDHYFFQRQDLDFDSNAVILMTEKDAVKCRRFADEKYWCVSVQAYLADTFFHALQVKMDSLPHR